MLDDDTHHALKGEVQVLRNLLFVAQRRHSAGDLDPQDLLADLDDQISRIETRCAGTQGELSVIALVAARVAGVRHDLRNKLMAVRNAAAFIRRTVESSELAKDSRIVKFFTLIDEQVSEAEHILTKEEPARSDASTGNT
jgi:hypothetical protein